MIDPRSSRLPAWMRSLIRRPMGMVLVAALGLGCTAPGPQRVGRHAEKDAEGLSVGSNVTRADYAGSASCAPCHADVVARWQRSPMHRMTRDPHLDDLRAPFTVGRAVQFKGDELRLTLRQGRPVMELVPRAGEPHAYVVTRVIGGRHREDFAGLEIPFRADDRRGLFAEIGDPRQELILPVSYVFDTDELRPKGYSVMVGERPGLHAGGVWNRTCVFCHNTVPWLDTALGAVAGPGAPGYQGTLVDKSLPPGLRWPVTITDDEAFARAVAGEVSFVGGSSAGLETRAPSAVARAGLLTLRDRWTAAHFVEQGIGCESCHGGSREHVDDPRVRPSFVPRASFLRYGPASGVSAALAENRACARCHQVLFSRYPVTWEGGTRQGGDAGGSSITSGEARDLLLSRCGRALSCSTCHDPHGEDDPAKLQALATPAGNHVCTGCHAAMATPAGLRAHAHHQPEGAGGACVACHMPLKNTGLGYALTRYHRLGSPLDARRVEHDRPLECALCHADASVRRLLDDIARLWGKRYDEGALGRLYGNLDRNALEATVVRGRAHEQIAAAVTLAQAGAKQSAPTLARFVATSAFPLARRHGLKALDSLLPSPCAADVDAPTEDVLKAFAACGLKVPGPEGPETAAAEHALMPARASGSVLDDD